MATERVQAVEILLDSIRHQQDRLAYFMVAGFIIGFVIGVVAAWTMISLGH